MEQLLGSRSRKSGSGSTDVAGAARPGQLPPKILEANFGQARLDEDAQIHNRREDARNQVGLLRQQRSAMSVVGHAAIGRDRARS
jgi:hypothetical protein